MIKMGSRRVRARSGTVRASGAGGMRKTIGVGFSQISEFGVRLGPKGDRPGLTFHMRGIVVTQRPASRVTKPARLQPVTTPLQTSVTPLNP